MSLKQHLDVVRQRIHEACRRCGRTSSAVTLVAVTKGVSADVMQKAIALGVMELGENRVQEARQKQNALGSRLKAQGNSLQPSALSLQRHVRWHLIGHLQSNKVKRALELFDVIHSVDSLELIEELERQAAKWAQGSRLKAQGGRAVASVGIFIQVNVSGERTKFGCRPEDTVALVRAVTQGPHLSLRGLMTIAPFVEDPERTRPHFQKLRRLRDDVAVAFSLEPSTLSLSMGMSQDFEVAIEEGADLVRIGSAIFGERST